MIQAEITTFAKAVIFLTSARPQTIMPHMKNLSIAHLCQFTNQDS